jgi:shikimate dehydrogenase
MIRLGLTGYPLDHSLSPKLQAAALRASGLRGEYGLYPVSPDEESELASLLLRVRSGELLGLNVTIPHKQAVIPLLDELTTRARRIGAVNTIFLQGGILTGDNTDAPGFLADLAGFIGTEHAFPQHALVLGAGGAARAVIYALTAGGWDVVVAARRAEQAGALVASLERETGGGSLESVQLDAGSLSPLVDGIRLLVNATSVGMSPKVDSTPWPSGLSLPERAVVYDLVYNPRETRLVREAREAGLRAATGLGMLVEQAALAFEIWTGCSPPRAAMWTGLEE